MKTTATDQKATLNGEIVLGGSKGFGPNLYKAHCSNLKKSRGGIDQTDALKCPALLQKLIESDSKNWIEPVKLSCSKCVADVSAS